MPDKTSQKETYSEPCTHDVILNKKCFFCGEDIDHTTIKKEARDVVPLDKVKKRQND